MAVLSDSDRAIVSATYQAQCSAERQTFAGVTKADIRAAVNAVDDWVVANAAAFNSAIPLPARTALTTAQKAYLLQFVTSKRYQTGV